MARFNFKDNPVLNDETFIGPNKFRWDGTAWVREQFSLNDLLSQLKQESVAEAVQTSTQNIVNTAPQTLDTIEELAAALGNDENFATTITNTLATKADTSTVNASLDTKANKVQSFKDITNSYTLDATADASKILNCNSASDITITIPLNATDAFPVGTEIGFVRLGSGTVTIAVTVGVTLRSTDSKNKIKGQYSSAALLKVATDEWVLAGSLEA